VLLSLQEHCYNAATLSRLYSRQAADLVLTEVMMEIFVLTFILMLIVFAAMAIGYMVQRKTIAGSCGGLGALGIEKACDCDNPCEKRQERLRKEKAWQENKII
jgi:hypothetical protein